MCLRWDHHNRTQLHVIE
uniref:Uncharacterized protein n=1 Tax=Rhizophora mucronata TaxID=61149 RepID=A0A2P2PMB5_RHIMU